MLIVDKFMFNDHVPLLYIYINHRIKWNKVSIKPAVALEQTSPVPKGKAAERGSSR